MKSSAVLASLIALALMTAPAAAVTRAVGQTLVYAVTTTMKSTSGPPPGLPAAAMAQYEATMAQAGKGTTSTFTFVIDRMDADGSAHLKGSIASASFPPAALAAVPYLNTLQATLAPDGRITPTYDPNMPNATTRDNKFHELVATEASAQNTNAQRFPAAEFNSFALGCAKRGALKPGDSWHVQSRNSMTGSMQTYDFTVADGAAVTMSSEVQGAYGAQRIQASGHYDLAARQVVDLHVVSIYDNATPGGHFAGSSTTDFVLQH